MRAEAIAQTFAGYRLWPSLSALMTKLSGRIGSIRPKRRLRVCESVSLGDKRFVAIVQFERKRFLVGCAQNSVSLLTVLQEEQGGVEFSDALAVAQGGHA
jgi:flagellar biogenesis protein FliO